MDKHVRIRKLLVDFALGELSPQAQADLRMHLDKCPQCERELKRHESLLECTGRMRRLSVDPKACESAERAVLEAVRNQKSKQSTSGLNTGLGFMWRITMNNRTAKFAAAAAVVMVVLGGVKFWPGGTSQNGEWWLVPSAAAKEIDASLSKLEALVYRQQISLGGRYVSAQNAPQTWSMHYKARDRERTDEYNGEKLLSTEWSVSEGQDLLRTFMSFENGSYRRDVGQGEAYDNDPVAEIRRGVKLLDKVDRVFSRGEFEGRKCVGFEVSDVEDANVPDESSFRIWLDVDTKLPVRLEIHGMPITARPGKTAAVILDKFKYYVALPVDMFTPNIPEDFVEVDSEQIRAAGEKKEKEGFVYAKVPAGLKEEAAAALKEFKTAIYWEHSTKIYLARNAWRKDSYRGQGGQLLSSEWYVIEKDVGETGFDPNDKNFQLRQTTVNFPDKTYQTIMHGRRSQPKHPIDDIWFPIGYINEADRMLENREIEGVECLGLEISAKKWGTNPDGMLQRLWFDVQTKLPVRMEFERIRDDGTKSAIVQDRFEWNLELAADTFNPQIPAGFKPEEPN